MQYAYPAIFTKEEVENRGTVYTVVFPDLPGCVTEGDSIPEAIEMAREALAGYLIVMQEYKDPIPTASELNAIRPDDGFASFVDLDMEEYKRRTQTKAVTRTVSLPQWLDTMARESGLNFSQTFQDAIKERLGVQQ